MLLQIRHLRSLLSIHETGSLVRAAERLHVTQSALSHQIKTLEHHYDTPLYLRNYKPLRLTAAGRRLLELAQQVLPLLESADQDLRRSARGEFGRLHIAIECHACFEWLAPVLSRFRRQWPEIEVDIRFGVSFTALPALQAGEVDLVVSSDPVARDDLVFAELFHYESRLVMARGHALARKRYIRPADLAGETLITYPVSRQRLDVFNRFLQPAGVEPAALRQAELTAVIMLLVTSGRGVSVLPDWVLRESASSAQFLTRPLGRGGMAGTLFAAVRQMDADAVYMQDFIGLARAAGQTGKKA